MSMTPIRFYSNRAGYTLLEALVSMTLFALVLGLMVQIFSMVNRHERSLQGHAEALDAAFAGLERCRRECRMAVAWTSPAPSDAGLKSVVEFDLPDYSLDATRLPVPPLQEPLPAWNPLGAVVHVRYELTAQTLTRGVLVSSVYQRIPLCLNVAGFSVQRQSPRGLEIKLTLLDSGALRPVGQSFQLPCAHSWSTP